MLTIRDKLKNNGFTDEQLGEIEGIVEGMINEAVETKAQKVEKDLQNKYDLLAEEYCNKMIKEGVEEQKTQLIKKYDKKIMMIESKILKNLDRFIDDQIIPQVSDEMVEKIALNETLDPVVKGIKKVLEENYIHVDSDGSSLLREAKQELVKKNKQCSDLIAEKMQLNERLEKVATHLLMSESTQGLDSSQRKRVHEMFKDKNFDEVEEKLPNFVKMLLESNSPRNDRNLNLLRENAEVEPKIDIPRVPENEEQDEISPSEKIIYEADRYML